MKKKIIAGVVGLAMTAAVGWYAVKQDTVTTDNAYIQSDVTTLSPEVGGRVIDVFVEDNQWVAEGEPLFAIDDQDYRANVAIATAAIEVVTSALANNATRLDLQQVNIEQAKTKIASAQANARLQAAELKRYRRLLVSQSVSQTMFDAQQTRAIDADAKLETARLGLTAQQKQLETIKAEREQLQSQLQQAKSKLVLREIALARTVVVAPVSGYVTNRQVQKGKFVQPGMGVVTLVPDYIWLEANFKETQLGAIAVGQPLEVVLDIYPDVTIPGIVESVTPATGAQFSLLPPQNATGNFVKVVQRIPVKIQLQVPAALKGKVYPGLSANVTMKPDAV